MTDDQARDDDITGDLDDEYGPEEKQQIFQDDLLTDDTVVDPVSVEAQGDNDNPLTILEVPARELKEELDKRSFDGTAKPNGEGEPREYDEGIREVYEGTDDDLYNEQQDAADQASDDAESQEEAA